MSSDKKTTSNLDNSEKLKREINKTTSQNRKKRQKRRTSNRNNRLLVLFLLISILILVIFIAIYRVNYKNHLIKKQEEEQKEIASHYNEYVKTNKETTLYKLNNDKYIEAGIIGSNQELILDKQEITYKDKYLKVDTFEEEYYIYYKDIDVIEELSGINDRYKKYIVFNKNIITNDKTSFYDEDNNLVYTFNKSFNLPIIVNQEDIFGVEFNDKLLYVKKDDVKEIVDNKNTELNNTSGIAVLNYHFFYDPNVSGDSAKCNQIICLSTTRLKEHLYYIKENNIFTPTMKELEMYIDGYIRLPKSVVITIDDGWRAGIGSNIISEYKLNATIFLMSKYYDPTKYQNEYIEVHSHGHDLHNGGECPGGQGGAIKCREKTKLLEDLSLSREKLNNTTYFCYPFYEYNDYSIEVLKEAGFTMAFGGSGEGGYYKVKPGINKFKLPRYVIYNNTSETNIKNYIG